MNDDQKREITDLGCFPTVIAILFWFALSSAVITLGKIATAIDKLSATIAAQSPSGAGNERSQQE